MTEIAIIGFGEAGQCFAAAGGWRRRAAAYDIDDKTRDYAAAGVIGAATSAEAVSAAGHILSLVTADQALAAAEAAARTIQTGALYFDMNSVAPETKKTAAKIIEAAGGFYIDAAIMSPVDQRRTSVPILLSGTHAADGAAALARFGFSDIRIAGADVGRASAIKMIRSVMVKGIEALTAEMMLAADAAGVADEVLGSLGDAWPAKASYNLERMRRHGDRRAAEMEEAAKTLEALGVEPVMTRGTVRRQRDMAE